MSLEECLIEELEMNKLVSGGQASNSSRTIWHRHNFLYKFNSAAAIVSVIADFARGLVIAQSRTRKELAVVIIK